MMDAKTAWLFLTTQGDPTGNVGAMCAASVFRDIRERLDALERGARLNLRECRGARGVDVGANPDAVCEVVGASAAENDPLAWVDTRATIVDLVRRGAGTVAADRVVAHVFNELRRQWKERGR